MSDTLPLHTGRKADYKETMRLIVPFPSSAGAQRRLLLRMLLAARHQKAVLQKFGLQDMWTNYTKWTAEAVLPDHRALLL